MMESIEKLREIARNMAKGRNLENHEECNLLLVVANEIEREIAERYMELPVDADGVPIRVGDELYNGEVIAFGGLAEGGVVFVHRGFEDGNYILEAFASNVTQTALSIAEKEVEIEELRRENYELCKENEELAHRRAELESIAHGALTAEQVREGC